MNINEHKGYPDASLHFNLKKQSISSETFKVTNRKVSKSSYTVLRQV